LRDGGEYVEGVSTKGKKRTATSVKMIHAKPLYQTGISVWPGERIRSEKRGEEKKTVERAS